MYDDESIPQLYHTIWQRLHERPTTVCVRATAEGVRFVRVTLADGLALLINRQARAAVVTHTQALPSYCAAVVVNGEWCGVVGFARFDTWLDRDWLLERMRPLASALATDPESLGHDWIEWSCEAAWPRMMGLRAHAVPMQGKLGGVAHAG